LVSLTRDEIVKRSRIRNTGDPNYIPSECLLHLLRASPQDNSERYFKRLFKGLYDRLIWALPRPESGEVNRGTTDLTAEKVRDHALGRLMEMLSKDRDDYDERLDYFEISFNAGIANLRKDAMTPALRDQKRSIPIEQDFETGEPSAEVERARGAFDPFDPAKSNDEDYRLRVDAAIDALSKEQNRIVTMIAHGIPIESKIKGKPSIATILGRSEKTIRNHRDKAYEAIRTAVKGDSE
jgi:DNA-directed RNA polymerase specialized sigma24 family protein